MFPQASAIKVPILLELFRRAELSLEDYAIYMIVYSDNTATNVFIDELGMDAVNSLSASLGANHTMLQRKMIRPEESVRGNENLSTPRDAARVMERVASCDLPMSDPSCARVREILEIYKSGPMRRPVPRDIAIAFKPGGITGVATVWALVDLPDRPYVLSVTSNYGGAGGAVIDAVSEAALGYFSRLSGVTEYGTRVPLAVKHLAARGESPALHQGRRWAGRTRREEGKYREYLTDEQRRSAGFSAGRLQRDFHHGLLVGGKPR